MSGQRRIPESELTAVAEDFYAAALGDIAWEAALERVFALMGASMGAITVFDTGSGRLRQSLVHRLESAASSVASGSRRRSSMGARSGVPIYDFLRAPESEVGNDPYHAWHARAAKTRFYIGGSVDLGEGLSAALSLHRPREQGQVQANDTALYRAMFRHFERAMRIALQVARAAGAREGWDALIDASPLGMVFLDATGRPLRANAAARRFAALGDGFVVGEDAMSALRRGDDALLQRAIARALSEPSSADDDGSDAIRLGRRTGDPDYLVVTSRLPASDRLFAILCPRAVVFITDPTARSGPGDERLRLLYGFTPAELRLAGHLVNGASLEEAAKLSGVGLPTLRTQLASMFRKTGTGRQSELLRRLLSAPWQIGAG